MAEQKQYIGQIEDQSGKCYCTRCQKLLSSVNFYTYRDGSKIDMCKPCLTAHVDNFDETTYIWILKKLDIPYIPVEWNSLREKIFRKDPKKMSGTSVLGRYLATMRLKKWQPYRFADSEKLTQDSYQKAQAAKAKAEKEKQVFQAELKRQLENGEITAAEYNTYVSVQTQKQELEQKIPDTIAQQQASLIAKSAASNTFYNPYAEEAKSKIVDEQVDDDLGVELTKDQKIRLSIKWGRTYTPSQWVTLENLYNEFMKSFTIEGAARIDTLKIICKTSLKLNQAIDIGDIDGYQKLSRVYDSMMKSAKFTQAQKKEADGGRIDSASAIVNFVEKNAGAIPQYECKEPQDLVDKIIIDLKTYTKNLIYEDKSLAREIEKYLQDKKNAEAIENETDGGAYSTVEEEDYMQFQDAIEQMRIHDEQLTDEKIQEEYKKGMVQHS